MKLICVINHCTYLIGIQTDLGNTAYAKRLTERMFAKIQLTMVRLTNLNFMPGYEVLYTMRSDSNYVVLESPKRLKQAAIRSGLMKERPKVNNRRGLMEFGILQYLEKYGEWRNRSTTLISRKGSSLTRLTNFELSGSYESQHLLKLKKDLSNGLKTTNLSVIMSDPDFLIACWVRIRSLRKRPRKGDFLEDMMSKMNRKQVPLCKSCHLDVHSGLYDGKSFRSASEE